MIELQRLPVYGQSFFMEFLLQIIKNELNSE